MQTDQKYRLIGNSLLIIVIYDPLQQVMSDVLTVYRLHDFGDERQETARFPSLNLGLTLCEGTFAGKHDTWLRWTDEPGDLQSGIDLDQV